MRILRNLTYSVKVLIVTFAVLFAGLCAQAQDNTPQPEYRGIWAQAWKDGYLTRADAKKMVETCRKANLNAIFLQVRKAGDAYYNSKFEPRATNIAEKDFDPLQTVIDLAHDTSGGKQRIEVHAWVVVYRVFRTPNPGKKLSRLLPAGHMLKKHPEWIMQDFKGKTQKDANIFSDPGIPGVSEHTVNVIKDIVENYDVDGLHMDYVRYPESKFCDWGYTPASLERFNRQRAKPPHSRPLPMDNRWEKWRAKCVTDFVRRVYFETKAIKPHVKVSAATIAWGKVFKDFKKTKAYKEALQDWQLWLKEGIIDFATPMIYKRYNSRSQRKDFVKWVKKAHRMAAKRMVLVGQAAYLNSHYQTLKQLEICQDDNPEGFVLYSYQDLSKNPKDTPENFIRFVARKLFSGPAPVPGMPWLSNPDTGSVAGTIRMGDNSPIENMTVGLVPGGQKTKTDSTGFFAFANIAPGTYNLELVLPKKQHTSEKIQVSKGRVTYKKFALNRPE